MRFRNALHAQRVIRSSCRFLVQACEREKCAYPEFRHAETLRQILHTQPFQPFTVHTVSGETYPANHPDFVLLPQGGRTIYIHLPGGEGESVRIVDTALIERLETKESHQSN